MPSTPTPTLGLTVPTVGGDSNIWGTELNNNWAIIDKLGAVAIVSVSFSQAIPLFPFPETLVRVSTGAIVVTSTIPAASAAAGKIFTVKKIDAPSGTARIITADGSLIEGQTEWDLTNQFAFVRLLSNGVSYDVIGSG
jgi:hypothetical protein